MKKLIATSMMCACGILGFTTSALATPIAVGTTYTYQFTVDKATDAPRLSAGSSYGTIVLTQGMNDVGFVVTLPTNDTFVKTGAGSAFAFNIGDSTHVPVVTITGSNATSFSVGGAVTENGKFGTFDHSINVAAPGNSASVPGPLSFDVMLAGIQITDFGLSTPSGTNSVRFSGDIFVSLTQSTGLVGTNGGGTPVIVPPDGGGSGNGGRVPEPGPLALLALGSLALFATRVKRAK